MEMQDLVNAVKKDLKDNECYRDLTYSILGNFSTQELLEHILNYRITHSLMEQIEKID